jgi:hypothetical protein
MPVEYCSKLINNKDPVRNSYCRKTWQEIVQISESLKIDYSIAEKVSG